LICSPDWMMFPMDLEVGALYRNLSIQVTDTFGDVHEIQTSIEQQGEPWQAFTIARKKQSMNAIAPQNQHLFFVPSTVATYVDSQPLEHVDFIRDEIANMAFGVEVSIMTRTGTSLNRRAQYERATRENDNQLPDQLSGGLAYQLVSTVPPFFIPFVPVQETADHPGIVLRRGNFIDPVSNQRILPQSQILEPGRPLTIAEEEVDRIGMAVDIQNQWTRGIHGESYLWRSRVRKRIRSKFVTGLEYDVVKYKAKKET